MCHLWGWGRGSRQGSRRIISRHDKIDLMYIAFCLRRLTLIMKMQHKISTRLNVSLVRRGRGSRQSSRRMFSRQVEFDFQALICRWWNHYLFFMMKNFNLMNPLNILKTSTIFWINQMRQYEQNVMGLIHHWERFCLPKRTFKMLPSNSWVHCPKLLTRQH